MFPQSLVSHIQQAVLLLRGQECVKDVVDVSLTVVGWQESLPCGEPGWAYGHRMGVLGHTTCRQQSQNRSIQAVSPSNASNWRNSIGSRNESISFACVLKFDE